MAQDLRRHSQSLVGGGSGRRRRTLIPLLLVLASMVAACNAGPPSGGATSDPGRPSTLTISPAATRVTATPTPACASLAAGPTSPPAGAVTIDPAVRLDVANKVEAAPPGTTFWLAPGTHTLGDDEFSQVTPKDGDVFIGAPGAVLDGRGQNRYAFTGTAPNVTIKTLTVRGFVPPLDEGVVNHDGGDGWVIEDDLITDNRGAGLMAGSHQQVRHNCLRDNGQYGMNAYKLGGRAAGVVIEQNEIVGNNADDIESKQPGCGCSGGVKFWDVNGADVRNNWVHDNRGVGLWADTNNNDFIVENNVIENNADEGFFYEISYNLIFRGNVLRHNAMHKGKVFADRDDSFPVGALYLSESGGEPRLPARTDQIEISDNLFENNWSGITVWENADRFCNSVANSSTGYCTLVQPDAQKCTQPGIATEPLYSDCRWKTQRVEIQRNSFVDQTGTTGCAPGKSARMAVLANVGTVPSWSPYLGDGVQKAISNGRSVTWHDNSYVGPWTFTRAEADKETDFGQWQAAPDGQDRGSTFAATPTGQGC